MIKKSKISIFILLFFISLSIKAKDIIATFKGGEVTQTEAEQALKILAQEQPELKNKYFADLNSKAQEQIVREIIIEKLTIQKAQEDNWHKNKDVQKQLQLLEEKLIQQAYITDLIKKSTTEADIKKQYDNFIKELKDKQEIRLHHIVLQTREKALQVKERIQKNQLSFEEAATLYSHNKTTAAQGGDVGYVLYSQLQQPVNKALKTLKKDVISDPIETDTGWHIVRLDDERPAKIPSYDEVKESIKLMLERQAMNTYLDNLVKQAAPEILIKIK